MSMFDIKIRISSNYETEEEVLEKFEKWFDSLPNTKDRQGLWGGNSCVVMIDVDKVNVLPSGIPN